MSLAFYNLEDVPEFHNNPAFHSFLNNSGNLFRGLDHQFGVQLQHGLGARLQEVVSLAHLGQLLHAVVQTRDLLLCRLDDLLVVVRGLDLGLLAIDLDVDALQ